MTADAPADTWCLSAWHELLEGAGDPHPFATPAWQRAWWGHFADGELHVLRLVAGGRLVGVAPLQALADGTVRFVGGDLTDYPGPLLAAHDAAAAADALLEALDRDVAGWRTLEVRNARPAEGFAQALAVAARRAGHAVADGPDEPVGLLELPSRWEDHLAHLTRHHRHELRRKEQRFARALPEARVRTATAATLADDVEAFVALHRLARGEKATFMTPARAAFFRRVAEDFQAVGSLRLDVLEEQARPLAVTFGFQGPRTYYLYNMAFDPEVRALAPGISLLAHVLRRAIAEGRQRFDFLRGLERYKLELGAVPCDLRRVRVTRGPGARS